MKLSKRTMYVAEKNEPPEGNAPAVELRLEGRNERPVSYTAAPLIPVSFSCRSDARLRLSDGRGCDGKIGADTDRALVLAEAEEVRVRREMASRRHGWKWYVQVEQPGTK